MLVLHIDLPTRADVEALATWRGAPAVSFYLATTPVTQNTDVDRIELKNLLKSAVGELQAADTPKRQIWPIEQAVEALIADDDFWAVQARSLAIFVTPDRIRTFRLPNRLVSAVEVADRFLIKPLLRALTFPQDAYVLAVSMGGVRLVEIDADLPPHEVKVPGLAEGHGERSQPQHPRRAHRRRNHRRGTERACAAVALCPRHRPGAAAGALRAWPPADRRRRRAAGLGLPGGLDLSAHGRGGDRRQRRPHAGP